MENMFYFLINDLARYMSSRGAVVEHPTSERKVMGSIPVGARFFPSSLSVHNVYIRYLFNSLLFMVDLMGNVSKV